MSVPITIIIPAHNQLDYCRQCIESLRANTERAYRLVLVDNASTDGVAEYFDQVPGAHVIHAPENLGFAAAVNLGMNVAEGHVLMLNSDTLLPRGWLTRLEQALLQDPTVGMVGPTSNNAPGRQQVDGLNLGSMAEIQAYADERAVRFSGRITDVYRLTGFCLMLRDTVFQQIGLMDETYRVGTFEDFDYCLRAAKAGYRLCVVEDAFVFHYGSRTFKGMGLDGDAFDAILSENEQHFLDKWGYEALLYMDGALDSKRLNREAHDALAQGNLTEAVRLLKQAIQSFPALAVNFYDLAEVVRNLGFTREAYVNFERGVRIDPTFKEGVRAFLALAEELGLREKAENVLADALANPKSYRLR